MKKIFLAILLLSFAAGVSAQTSANRTAKTKVSDGLALLPAQQPAEYNRIMGDFLSTGRQGVDMLTEMFSDVNNVPVNYALSGWAAYVTKSGTEADRRAFAEGILAALDKAASREVKAFYMHLLEIAGGDESVPALAKYIGNQELADHALAALVEIGSPAAKKTVTDAMAANTAPKAKLAKAVGDIGATGVETSLIGWLAGADTETTKNIYYALGQTGTAASLPTLRKAAASAGYADEPTQAVRSYVALLRNLSAGQSAVVTKEAMNLNKKALAKKQYGAALSGFDVYASLQGRSAMPLVTKATGNASRVYRVGVLEIASGFMQAGDYKALAEQAKKLTGVEQKEDIIALIGNSGDASLVSLVKPYIGNANDGLNIAGMNAAALLGGEGVAVELVNQMKKAGASQKVVDVAKEALMTYKGNVDDIVGVAAAQGTEAGRVAALEILARRGAASKADLVLSLTGDNNDKVAAQAYRTLPCVATAEQLPKLYQLLNTTAQTNVPMVQNAVIAALKGQSANAASQSVRYNMGTSSGNADRYLIPLAATGDPEALEAILEAYRNGTDAEKSAAIPALQSWQGPEAANALYIIARGGSQQALDAYISMIRRSKATPENKLLMLSDAMDIAKTPAQKQSILAQAGSLPIFQAFVFAGKYLNDSDAAVKQRAAEAVMNTALANKSFYGPVVTDLLSKAAPILNGPDSNYQREAIAKHLAELPQDGGYVSMFNGRDLTGWKGLVENPIARSRMSAAELSQKQAKADETMHREWVVRDGILVFEGKSYDNICTDKLYGDFEMYVDWLLYPDGPEADAGIYLRGTPQVQMWDIARTNVGAQVGSGGLYNNQTHRSTPLKVADNELGKWNTFYLKMVGDRVTVVLNGELVTDNVILENYWNRKMPIFPVEQIELQAHGTRVGYRNLYINELPRVEPYELSDQEKAEGYQVLFDGTNMHNWVGNTQDYIAEDGMIVLYPFNGHGGNLYTKEEYGDFVFRFEFMLTPGANNGLGIRTPMEGDAAYVGMELQILDDDAPIYSELEQWQYHGSVYGVIAAKRGALKPMGEWNYEEVYIKGNHIRITLNGEVIVDGDLAEASKNGTIDGKQHPGLLNKSGHIAFLGHGSVVKFRNIRVKRL